LPSRLLHGSMTREDRQLSIDAFLRTGGVLIATSGVLRGGLALPQVTDLVVYDVPATKAELQQGLGSFDRLSRRTELNVYALVPSIDPFGATSEAIQSLRELWG